jgi:glycosyltransferase involved in cell wall biosynthesis
MKTDALKSPVRPADRTQAPATALRRDAPEKRLLCLSYRFPPETYPLVPRVKCFLERLRASSWTVDAVTAAERAAGGERLAVHRVQERSPTWLVEGMQRLRLGKLRDLLTWPDRFAFWIFPAFRKALQLVEEHRYDAIAAFMKPFSGGLAGVLVKRMTGLPLVLNLNDSPTCPDVHPTFPSWVHYRLARWLEDRFVREADALVYLSRRSLERVRARHPETLHDKFHLIRRGVRPLPPPAQSTDRTDDFRIVYTGGTSGWYRFQDDRPSSLPRQLYRAWQELGRHEVAELDYRTHGPVYVGKAVQRLVERHPEWEGRVRVEVYGGRYPGDVEARVLADHGLSEIVRLHDAVPHEEALRHMRAADLLFMALPDRVDGTPGDRMSVKTYEYLMTDRPILAALPPGETRAYLRGKPGVHLTGPKDVADMTTVLETLAARRFGDVEEKEEEAAPLAVDRAALKPELADTRRARAFEDVLEGVCRSFSRSNA